MSKRGPKPAPTSTKLLAGTRKDRINSAEPTPPSGDLTPPVSLDGEALKSWAVVVPLFSEMGIVTIADGPALELYCTTYATWVEASKTLKKHGMFLKVPSGMIRPHPALKIQQEAARDLLRMLAEFGGTPSSRSRLKVAPAEKEIDPLAEFLSH